MKHVKSICHFILTAFSFLVILFVIIGYFVYEFTSNDKWSFFSAIPLSIIYMIIALSIIANLPYLRGIITEIVKDKIENETLERVKKYVFDKLLERPETVIEMNRLLDDYRKSKPTISDKSEIDNLKFGGENDQQA